MVSLFYYPFGVCGFYDRYRLALLSTTSVLQLCLGASTAGALGGSVKDALPICTNLMRLV